MLLFRQNQHKHFEVTLSSQLINNARSDRRATEEDKDHFLLLGAKMHVVTAV